MEPIVEARVMHLVGPVACTSPRVNYRAQVSCKSVRPRTGLPVRGFFTKPVEEEYGHHDTSDHHRCAAVARRRVVRPRALVLVGEVCFLENRGNPVKAARGLGSPLSGEFGSYAALVNPPERGRTDVVLTGPQSTHRYVWSSLSEWVGCGSIAARVISLPQIGHTFRTMS